MSPATVTQTKEVQEDDEGEKATSEKEGAGATQATESPRMRRGSADLTLEDLANTVISLSESVERREKSDSRTEEEPTEVPRGRKQSLGKRPESPEAAAASSCT